MYICVCIDTYTPHTYRGGCCSPLWARAVSGAQMHTWVPAARKDSPFTPKTGTGLKDWASPDDSRHLTF